MKLLTFAGCHSKGSVCSFTLAQAQQAFDDEGRLKDAEIRERLRKLVAGYLEVGRKLSAA
jgi:hypothetical protein